MNQRKSTSELSREIRRDTRNPSLRVERGDHYREIGKYDIALRDYNDAIAIDHGNAEAHLGRALVRLQQGNFRQAVIDYERAISISPNLAQPDFAEAYGHRGFEYFKGEEYEGAIRDFSKAIELNPTVPVVYNHRGLCYLRTNRYEPAIEDFSKCVSLDPGLSMAFNNRGFAHYYSENFDSAISDLEEAYRLNPTFQENNLPVLADAYFKRGIESSQKGEQELAIKNFNKVLSLRPDDADAYAYGRRGIAQGLMGKYSRSIDELEKIERLGHTIQDVYRDALITSYFNRGLARDEDGDYRLAIEDYSKVISLSPEDTETYNRRGSSYAALGEYELSIEDFNKATDLDPNDAVGYYNRGISYAQMDEYTESIEDLTKAIDLDPEDADAYGSRGITYSCLGLSDLALSDYDSSINLNNRQANVYLNRGIEYASLSDTDRAIEEFDNAVRLCPDYESDFIDKKLVADVLGIGFATDLLRRVVSNQRTSEFDYYYTGVRSLFFNDLLSAEDCFNHALKLGSEFTKKISEHLQNLENRR